MTYRITRTDPYGNREDSTLCETAAGAAEQVEEWTGIDANVVLEDLEMQAPPIQWIDPETHVEVELASL